MRPSMISATDRSPVLVTALTLCVIALMGCKSSQNTHEWEHNEWTFQRELIDPDKDYENRFTIYFSPTSGHMGGRGGYRCELTRRLWGSDGTWVEETFARGRTSIYENHRFVGMVLVSAKGNGYDGEPFEFDRALGFITTHLPSGSSGNLSGSFAHSDSDVPYYWQTIEWDIPGVRDFASTAYEVLDDISFEMIDTGFTIQQVEGTHWVLVEEE